MEYAAYLFGGICVIAYAYARFQVPYFYRTTTTKTRYWSALIGYVLAALGLYYLVAKLLETNPDVVLLLTGSASDVPQVGDAQNAPQGGSSLENLAGRSAPLLAAVFMSTLLPTIPVLRSVDKVLQQGFRRFGEMPDKAKSLTDILDKAAYSIPPENEHVIREKFLYFQLSFDDFSGAERESLKYRWVRIISLYQQMKDIVDAERAMRRDSEQGDDNQISRFIRHHEDAYNEIEKAIEKQTALAHYVFSKGSSTASGDGAFDTTEKSVVQAFDEDTKILLSRIHYLIVCGVMHSKLSMQRAYDELVHWGFDENDLRQKTSRISANEVTGVAILLGLFLLFVSAVTTGVGAQFGNTLVLILAVMTTLGMSIALSVVPKYRLPEFAARPIQSDVGWHALADRKMLVYCASALLAVLGWAVVHYIRIMLTDGGTFEEIVRGELYYARPFTLLVGAHCFALCWIVDNQPQKWRFLPSEPLNVWKLRISRTMIVMLIEATIMAVVLAGVMAVVSSWLDAINSQVEASFVTMLIVGAGIGFISGLAVPTLYRRDPM